MRPLTSLLDRLLARLLWRSRLTPLPHAERLALAGSVSATTGPIDRPSNPF